MKNIIFITSLLITVLFPKAQQIPIDQIDFSNITDGMYLKDYNNRLNKYLGTWNATVGNKQVKLIIEKKLDRPVLNYYSDALLMRYEIKINGQLIESTLGFTDNDVNIICEGPLYNNSNSINVADFGYDGGLCGVGWGIIYLTYIDATHLNWHYYVQTADLSYCQDQQTAMNTPINLPYEPKNIIFTKQ